MGLHRLLSFSIIVVLLSNPSWIKILKYFKIRIAPDNDPYPTLSTNFVQKN